MMPYIFGQCFLQYTHIPHPCVLALAEATCNWPKSFAKCTYAVTNACSPWLMLPIICRYLHTDVHRLHRILTGHI